MNSGFLYWIKYIVNDRSKITNINIEEEIEKREFLKILEIIYVGHIYSHLSLLEGVKLIEAAHALDFYEIEVYVKRILGS